VADAERIEAAIEHGLGLVGAAGVVGAAEVIDVVVALLAKNAPSLEPQANAL
jgi:hypothetical protein